MFVYVLYSVRTVCTCMYICMGQEPHLVRSMKLSSLDGTMDNYVVMGALVILCTLAQYFGKKIFFLSST